MAHIILNSPNSFVTFYDLATNAGQENYITDTPCGIQKDFCYPIYDANDLLFQTKIASTEVLDSSNIIVYRFINGSSGAGTVSGVSVQTEVIGLLGGSTPIYSVYISFFGSSLTDGLNDGDCFTINLVVGTEEVNLKYFISNQCFKKIDDKCLTSKITYFNEEDAFGFFYDSAFTLRNSIRLPIYFKEPIIDSNKTVYVRSDSTRKLLSSRLSKKYKGFIDHTTEEVHQKLVVALNHDNVRFVPAEYDNINGFACTFEDEYNNDFPTIMQNVNIWPADFTIFETPFDNTNSNCG